MSQSEPFSRLMLWTRGLCRHAVSVCPSVTFVNSVKMSNNVFKNFFHCWGSPIILVFPYQTGWQYSDLDPPNGGVECRGHEEIMIFDQYLALSWK